MSSSTLEHIRNTSRTKEPDIVVSPSSNAVQQSTNYTYLVIVLCVATLLAFIVVKYRHPSIKGVWIDNNNKKYRISYINPISNDLTVEDLSKKYTEKTKLDDNLLFYNNIIGKWDYKNYIDFNSNFNLRRYS